jgi:hypothetical protein
MTIRTVIAELFNSDRQTDMMRLTVAFLNVAKAPKMDVKQNWCTNMDIISLPPD